MGITTQLLKSPASFPGSRAEERGPWEGGCVNSCFRKWTLTDFLRGGGGGGAGGIEPRELSLQLPGLNFLETTVRF